MIGPLLPDEPAKSKGGRPRIADRAVLTGTVYVLKSGVPWRMLPKELGCGSGVTCWRRLRDWQETGVWRRLRRALLDRLNRSGPHGKPSLRLQRRVGEGLCYLHFISEAAWATPTTVHQALHQRSQKPLPTITHNRERISSIPFVYAGCYHPTASNNARQETSAPEYLSTGYRGFESLLLRFSARFGLRPPLVSTPHASAFGLAFSFFGSGLALLRERSCRPWRSGSPIKATPRDDFLTRREAPC